MNDEIKYPICPINIYWEGDEDICDTDLCDFDIEFRNCYCGCLSKTAPSVIEQGRELQEKIQKILESEDETA